MGEYIRSHSENRIWGTSKHEKGKRRLFAIASLTKNRWYWVVWHSLEEIQASEEPLPHLQEGYEKTKAEAVERALESAGIYAEWIAAKFARAHHRNKIYKRSRTGPTNSPTMQEFLYREVYDHESRKWISIPHRVVRKTRKYVYVDQQPYSPHDRTGTWLDKESFTFQLDRQMLEREGYAFVPSTSDLTDTEDPMFFNSEYLKCKVPSTFQCLEILHLSWPCTQADIKRAYRSLVKSAHPDGGGNQDTFLALQAAYEQALQLAIHSADQ